MGSTGNDMDKAGHASAAAASGRVNVQIAFIEEEDALARSHALMAQLRPHLSRDAYVASVLRMAGDGYRVVGLEDGGLQALAGIRVGEWLHTGRYLEIEDLVVAEGARAKGYGGRLFRWIVDHARAQGCRQLRLVSGVQRADAHRFYAREGMRFEARYFSLDL